MAWNWYVVQLSGVQVINVNQNNQSNRQREITVQEVCCVLSFPLSCLFNATFNQGLQSQLDLYTVQVVQLDEKVAKQRDENARMLVIHSFLPPLSLLFLLHSPLLTSISHLSAFHTSTLPPLFSFHRLEEIRRLKEQLAGSEADRQALIRERFEALILRGVVFYKSPSPPGRHWRLRSRHRR